MKAVPLPVIALLIVLGIATSGASAQTTRPAPEAFADLVQKLAEDLVERNTPVLADALADDATIERFGEGQQPIDKLVQVLSGTISVSARAYGQLPSSLATDLADDFQHNKQVPDSVRRDMIPDSESIVRANVTAGQWVMQTLDPGRRHVVGVIVVCPHQEPAPLNKRPTPVEPIFVLIKAEMDGGKPKIRQIVYGNPLDQKN
jgi:hypothetical protein